MSPVPLTAVDFQIIAVEECMHRAKKRRAQVRTHTKKSDISRCLAVAIELENLAESFKSIRFNGVVV
jgi:hypothetical protein